MSNCDMLKLIHNRIASGMPPEEAIPYSINCSSEPEYIELLYYASQVLPEGQRRDSIRKKLEGITNASRTDGKL